MRLRVSVGATGHVRLESGHGLSRQFSHCPDQGFASRLPFGPFGMVAIHSSRAASAWSRVVACQNAVEALLVLVGGQQFGNAPVQVSMMEALPV